MRIIFSRPSTCFRMRMNLRVMSGLQNPSSLLERCLCCWRKWQKKSGLMLRVLWMCTAKYIPLFQFDGWELFCSGHFLILPFVKSMACIKKIHINCPQCCPSIRIEMSPGKISLVDIQVVEINLSKTMWGYYLRSDLLVALAYESFHTYPQNFNTEYVSKTQGCSQRHPIGFAELLVHKCDLKRSDIFYFTLL